MMILLLMDLFLNSHSLRVNIQAPRKLTSALRDELDLDSGASSRTTWSSKGQRRRTPQRDRNGGRTQDHHL